MSYSRKLVSGFLALAILLILDKANIIFCDIIIRTAKLLQAPTRWAGVSEEEVVLHMEGLNLHGLGVLL
jgi:hypothetical protein